MPRHVRVRAYKLLREKIEIVYLEKRINSAMDAINEGNM
jgi:hypothetical protein